MVNQNNIMQEIQNPKNWKKTHKKSYEVYMCRPQLGTKCRNVLEGIDYETNQEKQFIISGTIGETWVVDINALAKSYTFLDGTQITTQTLSAKCDNRGQIEWTKIKTKSDAGNCWAFFLPKSIHNFPVRYYTANMSGVNHGYGDFLLCDDINGQPNLDRIRVINGVVFPKTYDLHGFPGMFNENITKASTPKPTITFDSIKDKTVKLANKLSNLLSNKGVTVTNINTQDAEDNQAYITMLDRNKLMYEAMLNIENNSVSALLIKEEEPGGDMEDVGDIQAKSLEELATKIAKEVLLTRGQSTSSEYPRNFTDLLKTYNYVENKLHLKRYGDFVTVDKEDGTYRIDFTSDIDKDAVLFMQIENGGVTCCYQNTRTDEEDEIGYRTASIEEIKRCFMWVNKKLENGKAIGERTREPKKYLI